MNKRSENYCRYWNKPRNHYPLARLMNSNSWRSWPVHTLNHLLQWSRMSMTSKKPVLNHLVPNVMLIGHSNVVKRELVLFWSNWITFMDRLQWHHQCVRVKVGKQAEKVVPVVWEERNQAFKIWRHKATECRSKTHSIAIKYSNHRSYSRVETLVVWANWEYRPVNLKTWGRRGSKSIRAITLKCKNKMMSLTICNDTIYWH